MTLDKSYNLQVFKTPQLLDKAAAELIIDLANKSIAARGMFTIVLCGGKTPEGLFALLSEPAFRNQIEWNKTFIFFGDERCVPLDDKRNNAHRAKFLLLDKIDIPSRNIYCIAVNLSPKEAADKYENEIDDFFQEEPYRFDMILLGLGENGHTASLFPKTKVIEEEKEGMRAVYVEEEKMFRITMTAPLINQARHILFLVTGKNKSGILKKILTAEYQPEYLPAQMIKPFNGELLWFVDKEAVFSDYGLKL